MMNNVLCTYNVVQRRFNVSKLPFICVQNNNRYLMRGKRDTGQENL